MKIAVTYDNGEIFQHFGKTESFKVYEVEDNKVVSSEVIGSNGTGHGALAGLLAEQGVNVLICGGIGGGAQTALTEAGIELCAGAQGNTDQAVESYLKGELVSSGANCDHHHRKARRGAFQTAHGLVQTPVFMNVGTAGAIKGAVDAFDLKGLGAFPLGDSGKRQHSGYRLRRRSCAV